jgi:hypothetical protein
MRGNFALILIKLIIMDKSVGTVDPTYVSLNTVCLVLNSWLVPVSNN